MKITCTRPNASEHISGIDFVRQGDGSVVAEGVSPKAAEQFANFEGFTVEDDDEHKESASKGKKNKADPAD